MDSKITKSRLSNFFAYEWIILIVVIVVSILFWELVYTVSSVRLSVGQSYKIYFDETINCKGTAFTDTLHYGEENSVFSYDVLDFSTESLTSNYNVLSTRLSVQEGDIIITDKHFEDEENAWNIRVNNIIDNYSIYSLDELYEDMGKYLAGFIIEGKEINKENLDKAKVTSHFLSRMKKDNRFRSEDEKISGQEQEFSRIEKLCDEYAFFGRVLEYGKENNWFYSYTRFTYLYNSTESEENKAQYKELIDEQKPKNYGVNIGALTGGKDKAEDYFSVTATNNGEDLVLLVFDFSEYQPDLQYESVCVINEMVRNLTGFN